MNLIEVSSPRLARQFLEMPLTIYQNDPNWIRPLDRDIEAVFDPSRNKRFQYGSARRWLLVDNGHAIGRVAAFYDEKTATLTEYRAGGIGFFECINDQQAANMLFDACRHWLASQGLEAMDGPINFGERDAWWGLLIEGFQPPVYRMNYNPAYYQHLFEQYGFREYYNQLVFHYPVSKPIPDDFYQRGQRAMKLLGVTVKNLEQISLKELARSIALIYNEAWAHMRHFKPLTQEQVLWQLQTLKPVMDKKLIYVAYAGTRPIGFFLMMPDINQIVKRLNGKFGLWEKLKFLWYLHRRSVNRIFGLLFGIVPDYQGKGVEAAMIIEAARIVQRHLRHYHDMEMNWIGDFNTRMIRMVSKLGTELCRRYRTYRYLFDPSKPFSRYRFDDDGSNA
ncbi:MAG: hypothetical protein NZL95_08505 [Chitinophagales bacterium]|nr:hypothetical protein [Chitinophagales bacterium]MDW8428578.1 hypothetical protein [Chitinophagales bacterium]